MSDGKQNNRFRRCRAVLRDALFLGLVLLGRGSLADHYFVPSGSMEPTLQVNDRLVVDKRAYGLRLPLTRLWLTEASPARGDIVVFHSPADGQVLVKRLVGLPGDRVALQAGHLVVNGERVEQAIVSPGVWLEHLPGTPHPSFAGADQGPAMSEQEVPPRHYLMLGDHRGNSADSRYFGWVPRENLLGRVEAVLYRPRPSLAWAERLWIPLRGAEVDPRLLR